MSGPAGHAVAARRGPRQPVEPGHGERQEGHGHEHEVRHDRRRSCRAPPAATASAAWSAIASTGVPVRGCSRTPRSAARRRRAPSRSRAAGAKVMNAKRLPSYEARPRAPRAPGRRPGRRARAPACAAKVSSEPSSPDRDQVEEDGAHRDVEQRHGADAEGERARQRPPRIAHLAGELGRLPPAAEREERQHEGAGERRHERRRPGRRSKNGTKCETSPAPEAKPHSDESRRAARSSRRPGRGRSPPRAARRPRWPRAIDDDRDERHGLRRERPGSVACA